MAAEERTPQLIRTAAPVRIPRGVYWPQIAAVTAYVIVALLVVEEFGHLPVVSAVASSAFLVLCLPKATMARPQNVFGGYLTAICVAGVASQVNEGIDTRELRDVVTALAVGLALAVMAVTHTEHVPAAGATLGLTLTGWSWEAAASTLFLIVLLIAQHAAFRGRLVNLF
jgi:CBS-domain-containing membrane protein